MNILKYIILSILLTSLTLLRFRCSTSTNNLFVEDSCDCMKIFIDLKDKLITNIDSKE